jgi:hypothetical protein
MNDSLKRLCQLNHENKKQVTVNVGLLKAAVNEIKAHESVNGSGVMTGMVLRGLEAAIERAVAP